MKSLDAPGLSPEGKARIIEHFDEAPKFDAFYMGAFKELGTERQNGFDSVGKIPRSKIKEYGQDYGYFGDDLFDFVWIIQNVDDHYTSVIVPELNKRRR